VLASAMAAAAVQAKVGTAALAGGEQDNSRAGAEDGNGGGGWTLVQKKLKSEAPNVSYRQATQSGAAVKYTAQHWRGCYLQCCRVWTQAPLASCFQCLSWML